MTSFTDTLRLEDVCARYCDGGTDGAYVVNDVCFCLQARAGLVALTGPNGCGKTTILRVIMGQLDAAEGTVFFHGEDVTNVPTHRRRGMSSIFQKAQDGLCASLTVEENLCLALTGDGLRLWRPLVTHERRAAILSRAKEVAEAMESPFLSQRLEKSLQNYPTMFSGGEVQQLCLLAIMIQQPPAYLLLADEPTLNLDRTNRVACLEMLTAISKTTVVLVATHDRDLIGRADLVLAMEHGRMAENR